MAKPIYNKDQVCLTTIETAPQTPYFSAIMLGTLLGNLSAVELEEEEAFARHAELYTQLGAAESILAEHVYYGTREADLPGVLQVMGEVYHFLRFGRRIQGKILPHR